jgi:hypothetical protein
VGGQGWNGDREEYCFAETASVELEKACWEGKNFESRKVLKYESLMLRVGVGKVVRGCAGSGCRVKTARLFCCAEGMSPRTLQRLSSFQIQDSLLLRFVGMFSGISLYFWLVQVVALHYLGAPMYPEKVKDYER